MVLFARDFDIAAGDWFSEVEWLAQKVTGLVEAGGEEAGFEARGAEERLLGQSDALDRESLLRVDGLIEGNEVVPEVGGLIEVFQADDGEG